MDGIAGGLLLVRLVAVDGSTVGAPVRYEVIDGVRPLDKYVVLRQ